MKTEHTKGTILIAVLNWGLGHATRCIPIIQKLQESNFTPIIASNGMALALLKKEFPQIKHLELPSYQIEYPKRKILFKWKLIQSLPKIAKAVLDENKIVQEWINQYDIDGIISDNRLGCYSTKIPSVYITHQINVMTGSTTWFSSILHQYFIKKFNTCWVPDLQQSINLAGKLSHTQKGKLNLTYIGPISRFQKKERPIQYQLMIILSGPEPQRSLLETKLITEIVTFNGSVLFVKGIVTKDQIIERVRNTTYYNYMNSEQLEEALNESELILCRSGYSSIMDLAQLEKKVFFIPTPGQFEQEYLAEKLEADGIAPYMSQDYFSIEALNKTTLYSGFVNLETTVEWTALLNIFNKKTDSQFHKET
ncbi:glycosyltransferase [Flavobacterium ovatum]|uniref:glycosyltransferase n=1 Tax=Flavobacterium ovatum TaxID=1928857 RepID=UPI00344F9564